MDYIFLLLSMPSKFWIPPFVNFALLGVEHYYITINILELLLLDVVISGFIFKLV